MVLILEECNQGLFSCIRFSVLAGLSFLIAILAIQWSYKHNKENGSFKYEIAPMLFCCFQALLHLIQYTLYNSNRIIIIASLLQLITFILVSQSLANLRYRFKYSEDNKRRKKQYIKMLIYKGIFYLLIFGTQIYFLSLTNEKECNNYFYYSLDLIQVQMLIITLFTLMHGQSLIHYIKRKEEKQNEILVNQSEFSENSNLLKNTLKMKLKQIKLVVWAQTLTMITFILLTIIMYNTNRELFCYQHQRLDEYPLYEVIIQVVFAAVQQFPCFYIPYAFYYSEKTRATSKLSVIDLHISEESTAEQFQETRHYSSYHDSFVVNLISSQHSDD